MKNKLLYSLISLSLILSLFAIGLVISKKGSSSFGGTTNFDGLSLSETLDVTGNTTLSGTLAVTGTSTLTGILDARKFQHGNARLASSTVRTLVLPSTALTDASTWEFSAGNAVGDTVTVTLPASTTLSKFVPNVGNIAEIAIYNSTTSATNLTLAGGTGTKLLTGSSTKVINPLSFGFLRALRLNNTDIQFFLDN